TTRSQHKNKDIVRERLIEIITEGLKVKKKRIQTKIPKAMVKKRLESKRKQAAKKEQRKKPDID
ncbi:MAG: aminoacyl-tRNA hydrolase, partial [Bacteroidia bacterium]|nr:aminoacyl-tRNA hydrolase [Bacteroidia bacterium]